MSEKVYHIPLTIADNGTTSTTFSSREHADPDIRRGYKIIGVVCPVAVGTKVAVHHSLDGSTFYPQVDNGSNAFEVNTGATAQYHDFLVYDIDPLPYVRLVSDASETGGPLTFTLVIATRG